MPVLPNSDNDEHVALKGRIDSARVDGTTEAEIARQAAIDDEAMRRDAAALTTTRQVITL